jgi:hypothetical protein
VRESHPFGRVADRLLAIDDPARERGRSRLTQSMHNPLTNPPSFGCVTAKFVGSVGEAAGSALPPKKVWVLAPPLRPTFPVFSDNDAETDT